MFSGLALLCSLTLLCLPGVQLNVFLGQDGAVQEEENSLGCDADSLHQRRDSFFHASLQISLKLDEFLTIFQIKDKETVSGGLAVTLVWSGISPSLPAISSKFLQISLFQVRFSSSYQQNGNNSKNNDPNYLTR